MLDKIAFINYNSNVAKIYAAMAQVVEHILGKDEVTSSNLVSSSQKFLFFGTGIFLSKPTGLAYHHDVVVYIIAAGVYHHTKCVFLST